MIKRKFLVVGIAAAVLISGAVAGGFAAWSSPSMSAFENTEGTQFKFKTEGDRFLQYNADGKWSEIFVKGVNLGATVPGHFPGELPVTEADYLRWFKQIDDMGANVIRVYTVHQPVFYSALVKYNKSKGDDPLYFMQGIWSPEEQLIEQQDAYSGEIQKQFKDEIRKAVAAVYGDISAPQKQGASSGEYKTNAGKYLMAWHVGTEWDPSMVKNTNEKHNDVPRYEGAYFSGTKDASAFENWLAGLLDYTAQQEQQYGWEHPMAFTNWVTTDVLSHPGEPLFEEDMVSVDATNVVPGNWKAGYFAAYHVYPYYPDFFQTDASLRTIKDSNGEYNTYKAYLRQLKAKFKKIPIMVTEYGVPSSVGVSHLGAGGRDQGGHNEEQQGNMDASLTRDIYDEGYAGAILFMWQDEWFKKTWNTMPFEIPADRRAYWINVLTNEKMFGLLAMRPGKEETITIDGKLDDWDDIPKDQVMKWQGQVSGMKEMKVTHDEGYLYIAIHLDNVFDPVKSKLFIGADTITGGNVPGTKLLPGKQLMGGAPETLIEIGKDEESQVELATDYDFHKRLYGPMGYGMLPQTPQEAAPFVPWKLAIGLQMSPPDTRFSHPFIDQTIGKLKRGTNDRGQGDFNSLTAWQYSGNTIEMRIPWMLLGFADPSSLQVIDYSPLKSKPKRSFSTIKTEGVRLIPWIVDRTSGAVSWPGGSQSTFNVQDIIPYTWKPWDTVQYSEQLKQSYNIMKKTYSSLSAPRDQ
ncbi:hypothetical protein [Paenibacillus pini]|uniref:Glycoside hydrolase family 2 catalytic domain-containing protein n=1 Tax=Paenibacillus pini JCM 16418 TaxID=1236976 RepID=W7YXS5_9BACL|nr:hypothetical protein [Paenibacillus pini]GAF07209.1 hypothetical protein JCM16418_1203 [Paenibacillus pini JCM 16418]